MNSAQSNWFYKKEPKSVTSFNNIDSRTFMQTFNQS